jgi:peptide/nickel transport system substrate-binding protein
LAEFESAGIDIDRPFRGGVAVSAGKPNVVSMGGAMGHLGLRVAASLVLSMTLAGCSGSTTTTSSSASGHGPVAIRMYTDYGCFDPAQAATDVCSNAASNFDQLLANNFYATLLSVDSSGKIIPYLAKSWKVTPTSIAFSLRSDSKCEDGTPVTATVVKNSFNRLLASHNPFNGPNFGAGPYTLTADDATGTFTFSTATPYSDLIYGFIDIYPATTGGIVCPAGIASPSKFATQSFGAGPYTVVEAVHNDHLTAKLRSDFKWGPSGTTAQTPGVPGMVTYKLVTNETTAANLLVTGGLDVGQIAGQDTKRLAADKSLHSETSYASVMTYLMFNEGAGHATSDPAVRQALITALDPGSINQAATLGFGKLSSSLFIPGGRCFDSATTQMAPKPSVDAAKSVLQNAGWAMKDGKLTNNGQALQVTFWSEPRLGSAGEYIQSQWNQLGATAKLQSTDATSWFTAGIIPGNFDASIITATAPPIPVYGQWYSNFYGALWPDGKNFGRINDPILKQEGDAAEATVGAQSCQHWNAFQEELWKQWHILPVYSFPAVIFARSRVDLSLASGRSININAATLRLSS